MENSLWTLGCSFTENLKSMEERDSQFNLNSYFTKYKKYLGGMLPSCWPELLSNKLDYKIENRGLGATSNYDIFYSFCDIVSDLKENDIVILQWTSLYRFLLAHPNPHHPHLMTILPREKYEEFEQKFIDTILVNRSNTIWIEELIHFSKIINEICKEKNVHLFYWTYDDIIVSYMQKNWIEFPYDKFIKTNNHHLSTYCDLFGYLDEKCNNKHTIHAETNGEIPDAHLGQFGHHAQSQLFYSYIKERI